MGLKGMFSQPAVVGYYHQLVNIDTCNSLIWSSFQCGLGLVVLLIHTSVFELYFSLESAKQDLLCGWVMRRDGSQLTSLCSL